MNYHSIYWWKQHENGSFWLYREQISWQRTFLTDFEKGGGYYVRLYIFFSCMLIDILVNYEPILNILFLFELVHYVVIDCYLCISPCEIDDVRRVPYWLQE